MGTSFDDQKWEGTNPDEEAPILMRKQRSRVGKEAMVDSVKVFLYSTCNQGLGEEGAQYAN